MRQGQQDNKRMRNRNRNRKGPNPLTRSYESNGGDVKIRGTALHVAEKYVQLARDAQSSGDRVAGENYLQHAEHYFRIVAAAQAQMPQQPQQPNFRNDDEGDDEEDFANAQGGFGGNNNNYGGGQNYGGGNNYAGGNNNGGNNGAGNERNAGSNNNGYQGNRNGQQPNQQANQPHTNPADQLPAFINGGSGGGNSAGSGAPSEQPLEGAPQPQGDFRPQGGQERGGQNPNFRRRRRPFREPYAGGGDRPTPAPTEGGDEGSEE